MLLRHLKTEMKFYKRNVFRYLQSRLLFTPEKWKKNILPNFNFVSLQRQVPWTPRKTNFRLAEWDVFSGYYPPVRAAPSRTHFPCYLAVSSNETSACFRSVLHAMSKTFYRVLLGSVGELLHKDTDHRTRQSLP